jgi:hypothetical protein
MPYTPQPQTLDHGGFEGLLKEEVTRCASSCMLLHKSYGWL